MFLFFGINPKKGMMICSILPPWKSIWTKLCPLVGSEILAPWITFNPQTLPGPWLTDPPLRRVLSFGGPNKNWDSSSFALFPIGSMYGILYLYTYIYHQNQQNVGVYTIHGWYGFVCCLATGGAQQATWTRAERTKLTWTRAHRVNYSKCQMMSSLKCRLEKDIPGTTVDGRNPAPVDM